MRYTTYSFSRGTCGHRHSSRTLAQSCANNDDRNAKCEQYRHFGPYMQERAGSDRKVYGVAEDHQGPIGAKDLIDLTPNGSPRRSWEARSSVGQPVSDPRCVPPAEQHSPRPVIDMGRPGLLPRGVR